LGAGADALEALAGGDTHAAVRGLTARMKVMLRITLMRGERVRDRLAGSVDCLGQTIHGDGARGGFGVFVFHRRRISGVSLQHHARAHDAFLGEAYAPRGQKIQTGRFLSGRFEQAQFQST
jgi:hypothetical protein